MKKVTLTVALASCLLFLGSKQAMAQTTKRDIQEQGNPKAKTEQPQAKKSNASYTCSMCGGSYDKAGKCPKCKMDLTLKTASAKVADTKSGKKEEAKTYGCCKMCGDVKSDKPGKCPVCGMDMQVKK